MNKKKKTGKSKKNVSNKFWKKSLKTNHLSLDERIDRLFSELEPKQKRVPWFLLAIGFLTMVIMALCLFLFLKYDVTTIKTSTMDTAISKDNHILYQKELKLSRFNIVLVEKDGKQDVLRVVGMPGDSLSVDDDVLIVNNAQYDETYLKRNYITFKSENNGSHINYTENFDLSTISKSKYDNQHIPREKYVLLGDNRQVAIDSRKIGYYDEKDIKGIVLLNIWPPSEFGPIE